MTTLQQAEDLEKLWKLRFDREFPHLTQKIYVSLQRALKKFIQKEIDQAHYNEAMFQEAKHEELRNSTLEAAEAKIASLKYQEDESTLNFRAECLSVIRSLKTNPHE